MTLLEKYSWLISTLRASKHTFKELQDKWKENSDGLLSCELDRTTFNRWREEIEKRFGLIIACDLRGGYYYYLENPEVLDGKGDASWILNSMALGETLKDYKSLENRVVCDPIPKGVEYIRPLLQAMRMSEAVNITYVNMIGSIATCRMEPYALRQHKSEWFLLYKSPVNARFAIISLSQINNVQQLSGDKFTVPETFDAYTHFLYHFGTDFGVADIKPCRVVVRARGYMVNHLRTKPLHFTQEEKCEGDYSEFSYYIAPTSDFINEILNMGSMVELVSPQSLVEKLHSKIQSLQKSKSDSEIAIKPVSHKPLNGSFATIDVEFANSNPSSICEFAVIIVHNGEIIKRFHTLVRPEPFEHADYTTKINGLTEKDTANAPSFKEAWQLIEPDLLGLPLIGYNASFDERALKSAFRAYDMDYNNIVMIDALKASKAIFGHDLPSFQLQCVVEKTGSSPKPTDITTLSTCENITALALQIL